MIFSGLLKNAQMQVELCEIPLAGAPPAFVPPGRDYAQAGEILCSRERFKTVPYRYTPQQLALLDKTLFGSMFSGSAISGDSSQS